MNDLYQHNLNLGSDLSYLFKKDLLFCVCLKQSMWEMAIEGLTAWDAEKTGKFSVCHGLQPLQERMPDLSSCYCKED